MLNGVQQGKTLDQSNILMAMREQAHKIQVERFKANVQFGNDLMRIKLDLIEKYGFSVDAAEQFIVSASNPSLSQAAFENEAELDEKEKKEDETE